MVKKEIVDRGIDEADKKAEHDGNEYDFVLSLQNFDLTRHVQPHSN